MYYETKKEAEEICFNVANSLFEMFKKINHFSKNEDVARAMEVEKEIFFFDTRPYDDIDTFETNVIKTVAEKVLDKNSYYAFYFYEDSIDKLCVATAIEITNKMLEKISFLGYTFHIKQEFCVDNMYLYLVSQDGREEELEAEYIESTIKKFIAEDILRISTGRVLKRKSVFRPDERDEYNEIRKTRFIIDEIADCTEVSNDEIRSTLENNKAEQNIYQLCTEISAEVEETYTE